MTRMRSPESDAALDAAYTGHPPYVDQIDSSVRYSGGIWFSSGIWAIKTSADGQAIVRDCRHFDCPKYWESAKGHFAKGFDSVAWAPASDTIIEDGFWLFHSVKCMRVNGDGNKRLEGSLPTLKAWPKLASVDFGLPIAACVYIEGSSPPQYLFFNNEKSPTRMVLTYTRTNDPSGHKVDTPVEVVKKFPALKNWPEFVQNIDSCLDDGSGGFWLFSDDLTCRYTKGGRLDPGPGEIKDHPNFPALSNAQCKEKCDQ